MKASTAGTRAQRTGAKANASGRSPAQGKQRKNPERQPRNSAKKRGGKQESPPAREPPAP